MSDTERGCVVPLLQAGAVGFMAGLATLAVVMLKEWSAWYALLIAMVSAMMVFVSGFSAWRRSEYADGVYYAPPAPPAPERVKVELTRPLDGGRQTQLADLPANYDQLKELADGVMRGAPFSETTWSGPGRPFTRAQFADLRASMMRRGWLEWRRFDSPGQGCKLTSAGKAVMRSFASVSPHPLPQDGD